MRQTHLHRVLVIQRRMTHYRVPFFDALKLALSKRDCELALAHGAPTQEERRKDDEGVVPWAEHLDTSYGLGGRICWQPFGNLLRDAELTVMTLENKLLYNLYAQFVVRDRRVALWGHGANLQGSQHSLRERFKRRVARKADWWFGYTDLSVPLILRSGFPEDRITVLNNAVDTAQLRQMRASVDEAANALVRSSLQLQGACVGTFVGSLYKEKRVGFMLDAALAIKAKMPEFEFLVVGAGPDESRVQSFCAKHPWAKYLGTLQGQEKANILALSHVLINPGLVGLGLLDAFATAVPLVTTDCHLHSPEIAYLKNGENGLMTADSLADYVAAVVGLLQNPHALTLLRKGCERSAHQYNIENMASNFADGVLRCLQAPIRR